MRIALFGGSGFIGGSLLKALNELQINVLEISRSPITFNSISADISNSIELNRIEGVFDIVIICSSKLPQTYYTDNDLGDFVKTNITGINNILAWSKQRNVSKIVYCSTLSFLPHNTVSRDEIELLDVGSHYIYKVSKAAAEHFLIGFCKSEKIDFCVLRIASVYGIGMKKDILFAFTEKIRSGEKITLQNLNLTADFVHVDDVVKVIMQCLKNTVSNEIINVTSSKPIYLVDLIKLLAQILSRPSPEVSINSNQILERKIYSDQKMSKLVQDRIPLLAGLEQLLNSW